MQSESLHPSPPAVPGGPVTIVYVPWGMWRGEEQFWVLKFILQVSIIISHSGYTPPVDQNLRDTGTEEF